MEPVAPKNTEARAERPIDRKRLTLIIASVWLLAVSAGGMYLVVVALKPLAAEFAWPRAVPSFAYSAQFIGSGFGGLIMGYLLDRFGFAIPALVGAIMVSTGAMFVSSIEPTSNLSGVIDPKYQLYLSYGIMFGLAGQGCMVVPGMANIARFFVRRRGLAVGIVASGQSLAGIVWPPIFGYVLAEHGWREMFFYYGVFAACAMLPAVWLVRLRPPAMTASPATAAATVGSTSTSATAKAALMPPAPAMMQWLLCAAITGCCVAMALPLAHMVALVTDLNFSIAQGAQALSLILVAAFLSRIFMVGFLADRYGGLTALLVFSTMQTVTLGLLVTVDELWSIYLMAILFGVGYGGIFPVYTVIVREHIPLRQVGRRTGMVFLFGASAMGLGSWMGGYLYDLTGAYTLPFLVGVGFNLFNLALVAMLIVRTGGLGRPKYAPG